MYPPSTNRLRVLYRMLWCEGPVPQLAHTGTHTHSRHSKRDWLDYQGWPGGVTGSDQG